MAQRGRAKVNFEKRKKLGYLMPTYTREMIVKIGEKTGLSATDALIEMIRERHEQTFGTKEGDQK